ncbi:MAG: RNA methyltransferase [Bacteroidales bacterium]|nr:RNA methyltransferase [Bacteroidales bacterium]
MRISKNQIKFIRSLSQKKVRDSEQLFLAEGEKCVRELLQSFEPFLIASSSPLSGIHTLEATEMEIQQMSQLRHPQGVVAVFKMPTMVDLNAAFKMPELADLNAAFKMPELADLNASFKMPISQEATKASSLILALDGVQDPGNLGTIIRTADWFGIEEIICSQDTVDCWNPKVVQATMGALARVHVHYINLYSFILNVLQSNQDGNNYPIYGTLLDGKNMYSPDAIPSKQRGIIIMGNEGNGISSAIRSLITHPLYIPSFPAERPTSESLNVGIATAIILAEFRR